MHSVGMNVEKGHKKATDKDSMTIPERDGRKITPQRKIYIHILYIWDIRHGGASNIMECGWDTVGLVKIPCLSVCLFVCLSVCLPKTFEREVARP